MTKKIKKIVKMTIKRKCLRKKLKRIRKIKAT